MSFTKKKVQSQTKKNLNLANISQKEIEKMQVDLVAAGIAFKERYKISVAVRTVEKAQPLVLQTWFKERLKHHRSASSHISKIQQSFNKKEG